MYNVSNNRNGIESYLSSTNPFSEQFDAMYNEGATEFIDQGLYYPNATNYGYYYTGFESPGEWEDHYKIFGVDGPDFQYAGAQSENFPYVYYTSSYGYAQSPYNPYNPFIPGAIIGVDDPFGGAQQYYTIPSFQDTVSSPAYVPALILSGGRSSSFPDPSFDACVSIANRNDGRAFMKSVASASAAYPSNLSKPSLHQKNASTKFSERPRAKANNGSSNQSVLNGSVSSGSLAAASSRVIQVRTPSGSSQARDSISSGKALPNQNQAKIAISNGNGFSEFQTTARGHSATDKLCSKTTVGRQVNSLSGLPDMFVFSEQNRGPRTNRSKDPLDVKEYNFKAGITDAQGNIIIYTDQYNKEDFHVDYVDAKFFVIKSYSEDDVHKSIKYGVWSSTSHGNKKLQNAYKDAQRLAVGKHGGCPIFLFFSVNASSQFCGVCEMIGPVDFYKDMDFWQLDKWSGSFPVKWHIIKDVPNTTLRHIILQNNENKPVTNSRDTQEIMYKEGLEMLSIFKNHPLDTSLFDDFLYYEKRQKLMQEERAHLLFKGSQGPSFVPALGVSDKLSCVACLDSKEEDDINKNAYPDSLEKSVLSATENALGNVNEHANRAVAKVDITPAPSIISSYQNVSRAESKPLAEVCAVANSEPGNVFTVGSVPIKVNRLSESLSFLKDCRVSLDSKSLQLDNGGGFPKTSSKKE